MKRVLSVITVLVLILGLMIPVLSLAAPKTPSIKSAKTGTTSVTISWNSVDGAQGYQIAWGKKGVSDLLDDKATTTNTSVKVAGLKPNTTYAFRIRAYYKSGSKTKYTDWSSKKFVTTDTDKPSVPTINGASYSNGKVTLKWSSDSRAAGYEVSWSEKGALIPWGDPVETKKNSMVITKRIVTGTTMAFRVRAFWWEGTKIKYTSWSSTKYLKTSNPAPTYSWGSWSDWTKERKTVNGNMQEETRHHWWAAKCKSCGTHNPYWGNNKKCIKCGKKLSNSNVKHVNVYTSKKCSLKKLCGRSDGRTLDGLNYWYCEPQYRYRYKTSN